jgi:chromosome partitioning protein
MKDLQRNKQPYVIAVANEKGGVGKSTTSLAVGTILAQRGREILFIDLDPQGNLTLSLGLKPHEMPPLSDALHTIGSSLANDFIRTKIENIDLLFARSLVIDDDYHVRVPAGDDSHILSQDLRPLVALPYDYVIIDCPPSLGKLTVDALLVSDFLIIPTQADFFSAYALKDMMELIDQVRQSGNPSLRYSILVTLFDKRNRIHHVIKNQLINTFGSGLFQTIIGVDAKLSRASLLGFPTISSRGVKQYRELVEELLTCVQNN